jgi:hypothetical protein
VQCVSWVESYIKPCPSEESKATVVFCLTIGNKNSLLISAWWQRCGVESTCNAAHVKKDEMNKPVRTAASFWTDIVTNDASQSQGSCR